MNRTTHTNLNDSGVLTPDEFVNAVADALPSSSKTEASRLLQHARAWADITYPDGLPAALDDRLTKLEDQWQSATN